MLNDVNDIMYTFYITLLLNRSSVFLILLQKPFSSGKRISKHQVYYSTLMIEHTNIHRHAHLYTVTVNHYIMYFVNKIHVPKPCRVGSVGSVSASCTVGREFASRPGHTKDHHKMVQTASLHRHACVRVGVWQCSPTV